MERNINTIVLKNKLGRAIDQGKDYMIIDLIKNPEVNINHVSPKGKTVLTYILEDISSNGFMSDKVEILETLLKNPLLHVDNLTYNNLNTLFYITVIKGNIYMFNHLLNNPEIDVNYRFLGDTTPLMAVVSRGYNKNRFQIMQTLLNHPDIDVNIKNIYKETAITTIVKRGNYTSTDIKMVKLLVNHPDINVNIKDSSGNTPIVYSMYDNYEITKMLIEAGAEISENDFCTIVTDLYDLGEYKLTKLFIYYYYDIDNNKCKILETNPKLRRLIRKIFMQRNRSIGEY